jgi:apolipoprotein N-acyltransferase
MVSVTLRFLATLFGSLAAFFIASHLAHAGGYISAYTLSRVDEFYILLIRPLTKLEDTTQKTMTILAAALVAQGLAIYLLFRRWDRPPVKKEIAVERVEREIPDRLRGDHEQELRDDRDIDFETPMETTGPSARAIEAARRLATTR